MSDFENELIKILDKEYSILCELEDCATEKSSILAKGDIDALSKMITREQPLSMQCKVLEAKRINLLRKNNLSGKTLTDILDICSDDCESIFEEQLESLIDVIKSLKEKNSLNNDLTQSRLEFYGRMRSALTKPVYGYDKKSTEQDNSDLSMIDRKI